MRQRQHVFALYTKAKTTSAESSIHIFVDAQLCELRDTSFSPFVFSFILQTEGDARVRASDDRDANQVWETPQATHV